MKLATWRVCRSLQSMFSPPVSKGGYGASYITDIAPFSGSVTFCRDVVDSVRCPERCPTDAASSVPPLGKVVTPDTVSAELQEPKVGENNTSSSHGWYLLHVCNSNHFHREKANLAITLHNDQEEIMAQATFLDYPNWNIATQDDWVSVFRELDSDIPCTVSDHACRL